MLQTCLLALFVGYVVVALGSALLAGRARTDARRRRATGVFLVYALVASFLPGLTQVDGWPFGKWALIAAQVPSVVPEVRLAGLDAAGGEHEIDPRVWEPLSHRELMAYLDRELRHLPRDAQDRAMAYLLALAEDRRARAARGAPVGTARRWLGPLRAPYFVVQARPWDEPGAVPGVPFVGLRAFVERWDVLERRDGMMRSERELIWEPAARGEASDAR